MKFLLLVSILKFLTLSVSSSEKQAGETREIIKTGICYNQRAGATFPDLNNCSQFMICMDRNVLILSRCPQETPYFNHCLSRCVAYSYVCSVVLCYGTTTTDYPWTTSDEWTATTSTTDYPWWTTPTPWTNPSQKER